MLANVRNEFVDVYEPDELRHRTRNECLPLPLLYAMCNRKAKNRIMPLLTKNRFVAGDGDKILRVAMETEEVISWKKRMKCLAEKSMKKIERIKNEKARKNLLLLLNAMLEGL